MGFLLSVKVFHFQLLLIWFFPKLCMVSCCGIFARINLVSFWSKLSSPPRWCTAAANVDKLPQINIIEFCVWGPPRKIQTTLSTSLRMHGGETSFMNEESSVLPFYLKVFFHSVENHRFSLGVCITPRRPPASCWWPEWLLSSNRWGTFHITAVDILNPALYLSVVGLRLARELQQMFQWCWQILD